MKGDVEFWDSLADKADPDLLQEYLVRFPNGQFVELARHRLERAGVEPLVVTAAPEAASAAAPEAKAVPADPPPVESAFCEACGTRSLPGTAFCEACGASFSGARAPARPSRLETVWNQLAAAAPPAAGASFTWRRVLEDPDVVSALVGTQIDKMSVFRSIIDKAGVADKAVNKYSIDKVNRVISFNFWALLFGWIWAVYRAVPYSRSTAIICLVVMMVILEVASRIAPQFETVFNSSGIVIGVIFAMYGNSYALSNIIERRLAGKPIESPSMLAGVLELLLLIAAAALLLFAAEPQLFQA